MIEQPRKPKSDDPKPAKKPVILKPLTAEETQELLRRYAPDRDDSQEPE